jgi:drug/metabolite transporter (DMT)-like permease
VLVCDGIAGWRVSLAAVRAVRSARVPRPPPSPPSPPASLQFLSVPLVTIFKNVTNIIILAGDWYFFGQPTSLPIVLSLLLMLSGAVMAGVADIAFSLPGYIWMALNCVCTAAYSAFLLLLRLQVVQHVRLSLSGRSHAHACARMRTHARARCLAVT